MDKQLTKMKDDPGSELHRALLHRTACPRNKHPAILQHNMNKLQTSPLLIASEQWWNTSISHYHYAFRSARKHFTWILGKADLNYSHFFYSGQGSKLLLVAGLTSMKNQELHNIYT